MGLFDELARNHARAPEYRPAGASALHDAPLPVDLVAFYLPQFHPVAENDAWWGKGFTEWTNVTKALPRFVGHYQPRLPADLGFYDLRLPDVLRAQARLARAHGVGAFCFHHYWFGGRRILETPLDLLLANRDIDIRFCLNWANENWTRTWDGGVGEVLLEQSHSPQDDVAFIDSLRPAFEDPRYLRCDGRPVLLIYRPSLLPDAAATAARWRERMHRAGLGDPLLVMAQSFEHADPRPFGLDAAAEFPPHKIGFNLPRNARPLRALDPQFSGTVVSYDDMARRAAAEPRPDYTLFRGVCPNWDNDARRPGRGFVFTGSTPDKYGWWLAEACRLTLEEHPPGRRLVFVNAWNEWAEGAYLEPDRHYGHAYLLETARVLASLPADGSPPRRQPEFDACFATAPASRWTDTATRAANRLARLYTRATRGR